MEAVLDAWEYTRLLSDVARTQALVALLEKYAAGARVLEVGCGPGLLSCVAARLGATKVYAVEVGPVISLARKLVRDNGLEGIVEVIEGDIGRVQPSDVDLAFSELLNADPLSEGVLEAMRAAADWVVPGGKLAPSRLRIWAALTPMVDGHREIAAARNDVHRMSNRFGLRTDAIDSVLEGFGSNRYFERVTKLASEPELVYDLRLGVDDDGLIIPKKVTFRANEDVVASGSVVWFEAELDDGLFHANPPGKPGHWGQLMCEWAYPIKLRKQQPVVLNAVLDSASEMMLLLDDHQPVLKA